MMTKLEEHYNKFNEEKRLTRRHGQVEFTTSMKYIHEYLKEFDNPKILDIGAGTGRYSVALANEGYDVTAIELVKHNLGLLKAKNSSVKAYQGNALRMRRFKDEEFDVVLLFGPMYHLYTFEDKLKALNEAKRVTKKGGVILVAYLMNEYAVMMYGFKENNIKRCIEEGKVDENFQCISTEDDLYDYMRLENINKLAEAAELERIKIVAADGPSDYVRPMLNAMDDETFEIYLKYHLSICERPELLGASSHTIDILRR